MKKAIAGVRATLVATILAGSVASVGALVAVGTAVAATTSVITNTSVNLRTGPSTSYSIIRLLQPGTRLTATGTSGSWTAVTYAGGSGYVWSDYVSPDPSATSTSTPTGGATATGTAITNTTVNVRTGPSTSYSIVTQLSEGVTVSTTGATSGAWKQIIWDGQARWLYGAYITPLTDAAPQVISTATATPTPTRTPTPTPTPSPTPTPTAIKTATPTPTAIKTATPTPTPTATKTSTPSPIVTVTAAPTLAAPSVTPSRSATPTATPTPTASSTPTPTRSATPTPTASATPTASPAPTPTITGQLRVVADVNLRTQPSSTAPISGVLPANSIVDVTGVTSGNYTEIVYAGRSLWIDTQYTAAVITSPTILGALGSYPRASSTAGITEFGDLLGPSYHLKSGGSFGGSLSSVQPSSGTPFSKLYEVVYPAGSASQTVIDSGGVSGGAQSYWLLNSGSVDEAYLRYSVYFPAGFNFVKGGKLPGLYGGTHTSGGSIPDGTNGFSTRYMWRTGGAGEVYAYLPNSVTNGTSLGRGSWSFPTGQWTCMVQHVKLNTPGASDGVVEVWANGRPVYSNTALTYRTVPTLKIEGLFFSTFFGGGDATWATPTDQFSRFGGFEVSTNPLSCS